MLFWCIKCFVSEQNLMHFKCTSNLSNGIFGGLLLLCESKQLETLYCEEQTVQHSWAAYGHCHENDQRCHHACFQNIKIHMVKSGLNFEDVFGAPLFQNDRNSQVLVRFTIKCYLKQSQTNGIQLSFLSLKLDNYKSFVYSHTRISQNEMIGEEKMKTNSPTTPHSSPFERAIMKFHGDGAIKNKVFAIEP